MKPNGIIMKLPIEHTREATARPHLFPGGSDADGG
jgi:hypothetical protein